MSPTITTPALMTGVGMILGTAAYMSPEQAKGRAADKRSDVWAYGCVLYEMLTARRAFDGDDVAETLAAVIRGEPDWSALPAELPAALLAALKRCVVKDRRERIGDIAAVLFALRESSAGIQVTRSSGIAQGTPSRWRRAASYLVVAAVVALMTSIAWWISRPPVEPRMVTRFALTLPENTRLGATIQQVVAISRDGSKVAYQTSEGVFVRSLSNSDAKLIRVDGFSLAFSPDGEWLAFYVGTDRTLRKLSVSGGTPIKLAAIAEVPAGLSWEGDYLLFGQSTGILRVSASGGTPELIAKSQAEEFVASPRMLPDGDSLLFTVAPLQKALKTGNWDQSRVVVQSLKSGRRTTVIESGGDARYVSTGHLVYVVGGVLFARPFSAQQVQATGAGVPVVEGIRRGGGGATLQTSRLFNSAQMGVSENGTLVYVPGPSAPSSLRMQLVLSEVDGKATPLKIEPAAFEFPRSSPDGTQIAYDIDDGKDASVWAYDLSGSSTPIRLTFEGRSRNPVWSSDGQWIAFQSDREGDPGIFRVRADGSTGKVERLTRPPAGISHVPEVSSPDGKGLLFSSMNGSQVTLEILSLSDGTVKPFPELKTDRLFNAVFSPDGRHIAYSTRRPNEQRNTLYVEPFPPTGQKYFVASGDAQMPVWSHDGRDLFFMDPARPYNGRVGFSRVRIDMRQGFALGEPTRVERPFIITAPGLDRPRTFDILPDGRFVGVRDESEASEQTTSPRIEVVLNFFEELKQRVPVR
jgi:serine/threonine-protein kinase